MQPLLLLLSSPLWATSAPNVIVSKRQPSWEKNASVTSLVYGESSYSPASLFISPNIWTQEKQEIISIINLGYCSTVQHLETLTLSHGLLWRPPSHTQGGNGGGWGWSERIKLLHFSTIFDDLVDDVLCSAYFYHFTLYNHELKIHHMHTECWKMDNHTWFIVKTSTHKQGASRAGYENIIL